MLTDTSTKSLSDKINSILPDNPREAITVLALNYACVACSVGLDDDDAIKAVRIALRQMRGHDVGSTP